MYIVGTRARDQPLVQCMEATRIAIDLLLPLTVHVCGAVLMTDHPFRFKQSVYAGKLDLR